MAQKHLFPASAPALLVALAFLAVTPARAKDRHNNVTISTNGNRDITQCSQVHMDFKDDSTARGEQHFTLEKKDVSSLTIHLDNSSGVSVLGWDRDDYSVMACKAAGGGSDSVAERRLGEIFISTRGGHVTTRGPDAEDSWLVYFIVQAPRGAVLDMQSQNGGLTFRRVSGTIDARATNGPIELRDCSGVVRAETGNGPIAFSGRSGDFHLEARNGPVEVRLTGTNWDGAGLDAGTQNGPLSLRVPDGYASAVSVESRGYSPFSCKAGACKDSRNNWSDSGRSIRMGGNHPVVRLRTVNGPVEIKSAGPSGDKTDGNHDDNGSRD